ncbi:hypothetical protein BT96DRAFT_943816 [Gymnopus androsaceus JB14]|uniref:Uncharacterized protein n=1 Tax=Gymnopus androsaceus JB14 TaxID=1447944 RepID=A0A6A4H8N0_9AGAR|nr:hypothetical protein BT96DRAFT_943816 [Gymnopus androsaceus JB14]
MAKTNRYQTLSEQEAPVINSVAEPEKTKELSQDTLSQDTQLDNSVHPEGGENLKDLETEQQRIEEILDQFQPEATSLSSVDRLRGITSVIVVGLKLRKRAFQVGVLSYVLLNGRLLWRMWIILESEPPINRIGFFSVAIAVFGLLQYYRPRPSLQRRRADNALYLSPAVVETTILLGTFISAFLLWWIVSIIKDMVSVFMVSIFVYAGGGV